MEVTNDNLQKYYTYLKGAKADVPDTFDSFQKTLSNDADAKKYYDYLKTNKFDAPDSYESFSNTLGLKKKEASDYVYPTSKAFSGTSSEDKTEDKKQDEPKRQTTVAGDLLRSLKSGTLETLGSIAETPAFLNKTFEDVTLRPIMKAMGASDEIADQTINSINSASRYTSPVQSLSDAATDLNKEAQKTEQKMYPIKDGIVKSIKEGKWGEAGESVGRSIVQSIPFLAMVGATAGGGNVAVLGTIGATSAAQRYDELGGKAREPQRMLDSWLHGGFMAAGQLVSAYLFRGIGAAFKSGAAKEVNPDFIKGASKEIAKGFGLQGSAGAVTQIGNNLSDIVTGVDPHKNIFDNVLEAGVNWAAMGGVLGAINPMAHLVGRSLASDEETGKIKDNIDQQKVLISQVDKADSDPLKEVLIDKVKDLQAGTDEITKKNYELAEKLSPEDKVKVAGLYSAWNDLQNKIDKNEVSKEELPTVEKTIDGIKQQIQSYKDKVSKEQETPTQKAEPVNAVSKFPAQFTAEINSRNNGKSRIEVTDEKTGGVASAFALKPTEVNGEKYWEGGSLSTVAGYEGKGLGQNVIKFAMENLPEGVKGLYFPENTIINKTQVPHIFEKLGKDYDVTTEKNGDVFIRPKTEETPDGLHKVDQEWDKNKWMSEHKKFMDMTDAQQGKNGKLKNDLMVNAQKLGIKVDKSLQNPVNAKSGSKVRKTPDKPDKEKIEGQKLLGEYPEAFQSHVNDVLDTNPDLFGVLIGGLTNDQRAQAFNDIRANKKSAASLSTLKELGRMWKEHGGIDVWDNVSKTKVAVSPQDIADAKAEILADKNKAELDKYSYEDIDKALEKGLITKDEYDGIKDYVTESARAAEEAGVAEENFLADNNGNNEGGTEKGKTAPEKVKPEFPKESEVPENTKGRFTVIDDKDVSKEEMQKRIDETPRVFSHEQNGKKINIVPDTYMKENFYSNWTEGGNESAYPAFTPKGVIDVAENIAPEDRKFVIGHEIWEQHQMENGLLYSSPQGSAHEQANKMEMPLRKLQSEELKPKGGEITSINVTDQGMNFKYKETADGKEIEKTIFPDGHIEDGKHGNDLGTEIKTDEKPTNEPNTTTGKGKEDNLSAGTGTDKKSTTPKSEKKPIAEQPEKPKGIEFKGKTYKSIGDVQDALDAGEITKKEEQDLREKIYDVPELAEMAKAEKPIPFEETEFGKIKSVREQKLIEDLKKIPTQKTSIGERLRRIKDTFDNLNTKIPEAEKKIWSRFDLKLNNLKENAKAVWAAYTGMPAWTDYKKALGDWSLAKQINDKQLMDFTKLAEKKIPSMARREAIVNYIEADGDAKVLKEREKTSRLNHRQGYKDAQNLTPDEVKIANSIKDYFDDMMKMGYESGILKSQIDNYVTHFGVRPDDPAITKIIGGFDNGKLNTSFKYAKGRVFDTFHDLENAGYRADKDFKDIIPAYSKAFNRTIFSRAFVKNMTDGKAVDGRPLVAQAGIGSLTGDENIAKAALVNPYAKPEETSDYRYINHPAFRDWYWATKTPDGTNVFAKGELVVHPDYHLPLSNILGKSDLMKSIPLRQITKGVNVTKQTIFMLSPFFHYIQEGYHALGHTVNPLWGMTKFNPEDVSHQNLIKGGLKLYDYQAKSNFAEGLASLNIASKIPLIKDTILPIQEYLFNEYIPRLKLTTAEHMLSRNLKRYQGKYSIDQIHALSASQANAAYGNLNYELIGRNPTVQHLFRTMALAPDFLEARTRFVGQALTLKGAEQRRALMILGGTMFMASRILNKLFDDDYHWDKPFSFIYKKNEYTLRSVPEDAWELINDPNRFVYNRMSPLFRSVVVEGLTKRDFRGIPESTEDWLKSIVTSPMPTQITRMLPEGWGKSESDNKLWDDFVNTIGLRERHYFTPVEKEIRNTYYERDPRGKFSENQKNKNKIREEINKIATKDGNEPLTEEHVKQMTDLINDNVKNGKLTIYQGQDLLDNIGGEKKDVMVTMYNRLPEDDKENIYNKMSDKEKETYPVPKGMYSPYNLLKDKNEDVYDRLIEYGGVKTIHQEAKLNIFNKNVKLDKKASEEFNDDLIQKYGEQVQALIGTDKSRFDELKKAEMPITKDNPEGTMLKEYLNMAWERAHLQAEQNAKVKYMNKK